jgi:hypothetical protein
LRDLHLVAGWVLDGRVADLLDPETVDLAGTTDGSMIENVILRLASR